MKQRRLWAPTADVDEVVEAAAMCESDRGEQTVESGHIAATWSDGD